MDPIEEAAALLQGPVAVVILAAGSGQRSGGPTPKQLLTYRDKPLLQHPIDAAAQAGADEILVVIGHEEDAVRKAISLPDGSVMVLNLDHADGLSVSLEAGLMAASPDTEAAVILLADQPQVDASAVRLLIEAYRDTRMPVVRAHYRGTAGPFLLAEGVWEDVLADAALAHEAGAAAWVDANQDLVEIVEIDSEVPIDVDTPEDYERLIGKADAPRSN